MKEPTVAVEDQKPGEGVDRTQIRRLLQVSPAERVRMLVVESRNVTALLAKMRRR